MSNDSRVISIRNLDMDVAQTIRNAPDLDTGFRQLCQFLDNRDQAAQSRHKAEREALERIAKYPSTRAEELSAESMREIARKALLPSVQEGERG
jgi:hypothetical protein